MVESGSSGEKVPQRAEIQKTCSQLPLKYAHTSASRVHASPAPYAVESDYNNIPVDVSNAPFSARASPIWCEMSILARRTSQPVDASSPQLTSQDDVGAFIILVSTSSSVHVMRFTPARRR